PLFHSFLPRPPRPTPFPYTTLFRSPHGAQSLPLRHAHAHPARHPPRRGGDGWRRAERGGAEAVSTLSRRGLLGGALVVAFSMSRSEEHTSELQSRVDLVCRLLLEKK